MMLVLFDYCFSAGRWVLRWVILFLAATAFAGAEQAQNPAERAEKIFLTARVQFQNERTNVDAAWRFARAAFDWAEVAKSNKQREKIAKQGIEAGQLAVQLGPKSVAAHYYLGMNLAELARTKSLGALKLLGEMEREFRLAWELDKDFDFAGPDRNLGLLYRDAPGFSVGDKKKARECLERAVKLHPEYPENQLNLIEAYLKWNEPRAARRQADELRKIWSEAKKRFSGDDWEGSWADWEKRWDKVIARLKSSSS